ncbi:hypothetical protein [Gymnodinialimonas sp.]
MADDCVQGLQTLLTTDLTADGPYIAENLNRMAGAEQVYRQSFLPDGHFLVETISPEGQPDTLHYQGGAWNSDGACGWTLAWQMDAEDAAAGIEAQRQSMAQGVLSATCTANIDGTERIEGMIGPTPQFGPELSVGYVVDADTRQVHQLTCAYTLYGMSVEPQYDIRRAPYLTLPLLPGQ